MTTSRVGTWVKVTTEGWEAYDKRAWRGVPSICRGVTYEVVEERPGMVKLGMIESWFELGDVVEASRELLMRKETSEVATAWRHVNGSPMEDRTPTPVTNALARTFWAGFGSKVTDGVDRKLRDPGPAGKLWLQVRQDLTEMHGLKMGPWELTVQFLHRQLMVTCGSTLLIRVTPPHRVEDEAAGYGWTEEVRALYVTGREDPLFWSYREPQGNETDVGFPWEAHRVLVEAIRERQEGVMSSERRAEYRSRMVQAKGSATWTERLDSAMASRGDVGEPEFRYRSEALTLETYPQLFIDVIKGWASRWTGL